MIYIITTETFPNGLAATQRIRCYAKAFADNNISCEVLCVNRCEDPQKPLGNILPFAKIDGYTYKYLGGSTLKPTGMLKNLFVRVVDSLRLCKLLLTFGKNDTVIFYSYNKMLMNLVLLGAEIKHYKTYYEINEHPSIQIQNFSMDDNNLKDLKKLFDTLYKFDGFLCISTAIRDLLIKAGIRPEKIHIVNMIVNAERFIGLNKQNVEPYIAYCGAADNNKDGVDQLIKAFAKIVKDYPDVKLYIIGPKRDDIGNEKLVKELGISNKVLFTGMILQDELPQMLVNALALALNRPNSIQAQYGFPTKLGEYLLTGNPVIVTNVGDISLFLKDGESAYISEPDNILEFSSKLRELLSNIEYATKIGLKGKKIAESNFISEIVGMQVCKNILK